MVLERLVNIFARMAEWILGIIPLWVIALIILVVIAWNSISFKRLNFNESLAIDSRGTLIEKRGVPELFGYTYIITLFKWEQILRTVIVKTEYSIDLYKDKEAWIDLTGGGRVTVLSPKIWIRINNPIEAVKTTYDGGSYNFEERVRNIVTTEMSNYIRTFSVDDIMKMSKEEKNNSIFGQLKGLPFYRKLKDEGIELTGLTMRDINFSEEVSKKRREEFDSRLGIKISENNAMAEAQKRSGSALPSVDSLLKANPGMSRDRAIEIWYDLQQRSTGTKITNEFDFGGSKNPLAEAAAVHGTINPPKKRGKEEKDFSFSDYRF